MSITWLEGFCKTEIVNMTDEWIVGRNAKRNRAILLSRFLDGMTYEQIADVYDLSVTQVKRIVYRGEDTIFRHVRKK